ncbi:MAG TPA: Gfo/Idh/MocA family oxidoreductase [Dehalococcoidia bacterium]|jgi:predicted dehydrogenase|nr:Gfo/Idh/MocA family oxidoreductase [Dehalococcoidia bacterium]
MTQQTGIAVIGTGGIAEAHIFAYQREAERARLVAVADVERPRAEAAASRHGIGTVLSDYREALSRDDVQAVSICTPPFTHVEIALAALRAGKHVLCEKPVAGTLSGVDSIEQAQGEGERVFSGVFQLRFGRGARQVRILVDEGKFGRLYLGVAETLWFRDQAYYEDVPWRGNWKHECGGVTVSQAVHLIDLLLWYFGEPESVFAEAGVFRTRTETDDVSVAVVRFKSGAIGQITSTVSAFGEERSRVELYGSELTAISQGSAYAASSEPFRLSGWEADRAEEMQREIEERVPSGYRVLHRGAVGDFLDAIESGRGPLVGIEECRRALQVTTGIYKSAMTGQPVNLPILPDDPFYDSLPPAGFSLSRK